MKKWLGILLCLLLAVGSLTVAGAAVEQGFTAGTIQSFELEADTAYTNKASGTTPEAIAALKELLASATVAASKPADSQVIAVLRVVSADKTREYKLYKSGGEYLLAQGNIYRKVTYNDFNKVVNQIGTDLVYKHYTYPTAVLKTDSGEVTLNGANAYSDGTYQYRRLSGKFNTARKSAATITAYPEIISGSGGILIPTMDPKPASMNIQVKQKDKLLWEGDEKAAQSYRLPEQGSYDILVQMQEDSEIRRFDLTYRYQLVYSDGLTFTVDGNDTYLGEVVVLRVNGGDAQTALATYTTNINFAIAPRFFRESDSAQIMLFPVSYLNAAGQHWVEVACGDEKARFTIDAKDKQWQRQDLTVSSSTAQETINSQKANTEYEQVIAPLRSVMDNKQYWSGRFILPVSDDKVTTEFGMVRYTNGQKTSVRHGALDLAVPRGTPVKATGAGRVLYAGFLQLTGNTVLIEHGYGLKSWYYHMDSLSVATNDVIEQGKAIGTVGSTGFSTGPHLHFGMSVNNVFINPYTVVQTDLLV